MDEKFKNIIQEKVKDFSIEPNTDSWLAIDNQLKKHERVQQYKFIRYAIAASLAVLLTIGGIVLFNQDKKQNKNLVAVKQDNNIINNDILNTTPSNKAVTIINKHNADKAQSTLTLNNINTTKKQRKALEKFNNREIININLSKPHKNIGAEKIQKSMLQYNKSDEMIAAADINEDNSTIETDKIDAINNHKQEVNSSPFTMLKSSKKDENIAIGVLFASNASSSYEKNSLPNNPMLLIDLTTSTYTGFYFENAKADHKFPLSFGFSLRKNISPNFAFETGVNYTYLKSTFISNSTTKEQSLHYIGIPISGIASIKKFGHFSLYLSAGAVVEKNISGNSAIFSKDNKIESKNFTISKLQLSTNANLGLNYRFYNNMSLYVEPGWSYYFKNGSGVNSYRTEHPSSFNFRIGYRLDL